MAELRPRSRHTRLCAPLVRVPFGWRELFLSLATNHEILRPRAIVAPLKIIFSEFRSRVSALRPRPPSPGSYPLQTFVIAAVSLGSRSAETNAGFRS